MSKISCLAVTATTTLVMAACSSQSVDNSGEMQANRSAPLVQKAFATQDKETLVPVLTAPKAKCRLHLEGDISRDFPVFADEDGIVQLNLQTSAVAGERQNLSLDCQTEDGEVWQQPFELEITSDPVEQVVPPAGAFPRTQVVRAALEDDGDTLSQATLIERGYPPRPDRLRNPAAYKRWRNRVAKPSRFVEPLDVELPGHVNTGFTGASISNIWSGAAIPSAGWEEVDAEWDVPSVNAPLADCAIAGITYASAWVGLGGFGDMKLIQDGVEMDSLCYLDPSLHQVRYNSYYAWWEVLPAAATSFSNIPVRPGDHVYFMTWAGDYAGNEVVAGGYAWFYAANDTLNYHTTKRAYIPSNNVPVGSSAEWIVERPTVNGTPAYYLSNYGSVTFNGFADNATTTVTPWDPGSTEITMHDGINTLSIGSFDSNHNMKAQWLWYH